MADRPAGGGLEEIVRAGRLLGERGLLVADDGNLSARGEEGSIWITARGARKDRLRPVDLVRVDATGRRIGGTAEPSSELLLHLAIYRARADVGAVIHAHPPFATAFAAARLPIEADILDEAMVALGRVPVVLFSMPGAPEVAEAVRPILAECQAFLLANHGAVSMGRDIEDACRRMERLEHTARTILLAGLIDRSKAARRAQAEPSDS